MREIVNGWLPAADFLAKLRPNPEFLMNIQRSVIASALLGLTVCATPLSAQKTHHMQTADRAAIQTILQEEVSTWNKGDATGYSRHFAEDGTFTNIQGMFFTGHKAFLERHEEIFKGTFRGTALRQEVVSIRFVRPDVAIVETLTWLSGFSDAGPPTNIHLDAKGRLRTRLMQILVRTNGEWKIASYHNVDVKPSIPTPEPK
jgi:uncharacterized protein (TIGR02246 family)